MTVILRNELYIITIDERYIDGRWVSPEERMSYFQLSTMFYVISMPYYNAVKFWDCSLLLVASLGV